MNELEKILKDVIYGGVGAVATVAEVGGEVVKVFVEKGEGAVRQGQAKADEFFKHMKQACEEALSDPGIDLASLTRAQRDTLRQQLAEMDQDDDLT